MICPSLMFLFLRAPYLFWSAFGAKRSMPKIWSAKAFCWVATRALVRAGAKAEAEARREAATMAVVFMVSCSVYGIPSAELSSSFLLGPPTHLGCHHPSIILHRFVDLVASRKHVDSTVAFVLPTTESEYQ